MTLVLPPRPTRECGLTISCAVSNPRIELQNRWKSAVWLRAAREKPRSQERGLSCAPYERLLLVGSLRARLPRSHGNNNVLALLVVQVLHAQLHFVLVHAKLCFLPNRQEHGMLIVLGTNPVNNSIRLHQVLLTEQHVGLLVSRVCPQDLTRKALTALLVGPTLHRIHLQERARVVCSLPARVGACSSENQNQCQSCRFHLVLSLKFAGGEPNFDWIRPTIVTALDMRGNVTKV